MNKLQIKDLITFIARPYVLIGLVLGIGVLLNGFIVSQFVIPGIQEQKDLQTQIDRFKQQQSTLSARPAPVKVSGQELSGIVSQVPVKEELPRFIMELKETEKLSGASVIAVKEGKNDQRTTETGAAPKAQGTGGGVNANTGVVNSGTAAPGTGSIGTGKAAVEAKALQVQVHGGYRQVVAFMNRLQQLDRLVTIHSWTLSPDVKESNPLTFNASAMWNALTADSSSARIAESQEQSTREMMNLTLNLSIYSAKAYAGKFPDLPPISLPQIDNRLDPTWNEDMFRALLQKQSP